MSKHYAWVREHLKRNGFRLQKGDPPEVINFLFYMDVSNDGTYSFRRSWTTCRMNVQYFHQLKMEGIASASQKAYLDAVEEANDPYKMHWFTQRERYLKIFSESFESLYRLSNVEIMYLDRQIAERMVTKWKDERDKHEREMTEELFKRLKRADNRYKDPAARKKVADWLEEQLFDVDSLRLRGYKRDPVFFVDYKWDLDIMAWRLVNLREPHYCSEEIQAESDAKFSVKCKEQFEWWSLKLKRSPVVSKAQMDSVRMDTVTGMMSQLDFEKI